MFPTSVSALSGLPCSVVVVHLKEQVWYGRGVCLRLSWQLDSHRRATWHVQLQEVTFKNCALLRSESLHQLQAASPSKLSAADGSLARPPLAERNKGLQVSFSDGSTPVKKLALSAHFALTRATPPSVLCQSAREEKENKASL